MVDDRSHIEYHVGSRAKIRVAPPCLVEAGSALRWFTFNHKSENMMLATSIWLDCTSNKCDYSINDNGKLKKCRHVSPHERLNRGQRSKRLKNDTQRHLDMDVSDIDVSERNSSMYCMICERWLRTYHWGNHKIGMKHCRYARQARNRCGDFVSKISLAANDSKRRILAQASDDRSEYLFVVSSSPIGWHVDPSYVMDIDGDFSARSRIGNKNKFSCIRMIPIALSNAILVPSLYE